MVFGFIIHFNGEAIDNQNTKNLSKNITYKSNISGKHYYILMDTGSVNQNKIGAYQGCETVSLYNALVYLGDTKGESVTTVINSLPFVDWGANPNTGYAGNPWITDADIPDGGYPTIWPNAMIEFAKNYDPAVKDISGADMKTIENAIMAGNPVEMWVTIGLAAPQITYTDYYGHKALNNTHAVLLDGYNSKTDEFHVTDPIDGKYWKSVSVLSSIYYGTNQFAIELVK
ncbi:C39 family peptidase [Lactococcus nasutitermitis]|uniref:C39 family peptidase n=1 Tax=Lactococcus nasutitermitis TaxID=1652957 RepID=A0ABV9JGC4_9LACT|nr:C39 family peptidase [Lactococcus nasutitermitis]